jgi:hypothetical protein
MERDGCRASQTFHVGTRARLSGRDQNYQESFTVKLVRAVLPVCFLTFVAGGSTYAQTIDFAGGIGTAMAPARSTPIDTFGDGNLFFAPKMTGAFGKVSGDVMLKRGFGIGAEYSFRFSQGNYAGLTYRPSFYDVNAIFAPHLPGRIQPEFQAGLGGMNMRFYFPQSQCDSFAGCSNSNNFLESSNHLQVHGLVGLRLYVTPRVFIRPEAEVHWVHDLFQFGSRYVPQYGASIGYSFGGK